MDYTKIIQVYFIGIGGIGMSALARYFLAGGCEVAGYDRTSTELTNILMQQGCKIHYDDDISLIPGHFTDASLKQSTLVVYTPAIPGDHREYHYFLDREYHLLKRSAVLGDLSKQLRSVCVAGTHGKTTISTMIAHILKQSELDCTAFLGGISKNYNSNLIIGEGEWAVMEADEFDRSFLYLEPEIAIISSMDADHLDIYGEKRALVEAFNLFVQKVKNAGFLIVKDTVRMHIRVEDGARVFTYGMQKGADFFPENLHLINDCYVFDLSVPGSKIPNLRLGFPGKINVENAVAAISVAWILKIPAETIRKAMMFFAGIQRRFDIRFKSECMVYIDDYAHHPEELNACIGSVRDLYPGKRITGIFQPHLYTRTKDFYPEFADSLDRLDEVILLDIYPAREKPIQGITSEIILEKMQLEKKQILSKDQTLGYIKKLDTDVLLTLGAGDIDTMPGPVEELLKTRFGENANKL